MLLPHSPGFAVRGVGFCNKEGDVRLKGKASQMTSDPGNSKKTHSGDPSRTNWSVWAIFSGGSKRPKPSPCFVKHSPHDCKRIM